jgi:hypothetical protein
MKEDIRIAEYFYTVREKADLYLLSDGSTAFADDKDFFARLEAQGLTVIDNRSAVKKTIKWCKVTAMEVLEEGTWAGRYIPIVPVYGQQLIVDAKRKKFGLVRMAKDPQRMYNFWQTAFTESVALAPKAKWLIAEGQDEGHEMEWANANIKSAPVLRYKQKDIEGQPAPAPQRLQPEPPPAGVISASAAINQDLMAVLGIYDPSQLNQGNISGKAINGQQQQSDLSNFHFYDNLTRSIRWTGKIILDLVPNIYDAERVMRIIGEDGKPEIVTINQRTTDEFGVETVLNDVTIGQYDVVMETGPGFNSKRQEAVASMMPLLAGNAELFNLAGDLVFRNMDFPGADIIADRLAAVNPLAQIDEKSDIPPQVQMQLAQSKKMIDELTQQMQAMGMDMKYGMSVSQMKEQESTKRTLMQVTAKAHDAELKSESIVNQVNVKAVTAQNKTEIDAIVKLLLQRMDTKELISEIERLNNEQIAYTQQAAYDVDEEQNPLMNPGVQNG